MSTTYTHTKLHTSKITNLLSKIGKADKTSFDYTLAMANMVADALSWWKAEGKESAKAMGYTPNAEQFAIDQYGFQKSFMYKLAKVGAMPQETIENFKLACDTDEQNGGRPTRSIEALIKWANATPNEEGGEEGEEGGEEGAEIKQKPIVTFTCRLADLGLSEKNLSLRIDADGNITTTSSAEQIAQAVAILQSALSQSQQ